jgi:hypothetical protein
VRGAGKARIRRRGGIAARPGIRATWALWLAIFALVGQIFASPLHKMAAPAEIASGLTALFGDTAILCLHDDGGPSPGGHERPCDECCPLCQIGAGALALLVPTPSLPPVRVDVVAESLAPPADEPVRKPSANPLARARAPPFEA